MFMNSPIVKAVSPRITRIDAWQARWRGRCPRGRRTMVDSRSAPVLGGTAMLVRQKNGETR